MTIYLSKKVNLVMSKTDEELKQMLLDQFKETYPDPLMPDWIKKRIHFEFYPNQKKKVLELNVFFIVPAPLDENYYWEENNGHKRLVHADKITGEKKIVISKDDHANFFIFKANLNKNMQVEVTEKVDLSKLKESDFSFWPE